MSFSKLSKRQRTLPHADDKADALYHLINCRFTDSYEKRTLLNVVKSVKKCSLVQYPIMQTFLHSLENAFTTYHFEESTDIVHFLEMANIYKDMLWEEFEGVHPGTREWLVLENILAALEFS